jgi:hypothetical protein
VVRIHSPRPQSLFGQHLMDELHHHRTFAYGEGDALHASPHGCRQPRRHQDGSFRAERAAPVVMNTRQPDSHSVGRSPFFSGSLLPRWLLRQPMTSTVGARLGPIDRSVPVPAAKALHRDA